MCYKQITPQNQNQNHYKYEKLLLFPHINILSYILVVNTHHPL